MRNVSLRHAALLVVSVAGLVVTFGAAAAGFGPGTSTVAETSLRLWELVVLQLVPMVFVAGAMYGGFRARISAAEQAALVAAKAAESAANAAASAHKRIDGHLQRHVEGD